MLTPDQQRLLAAMFPRGPSRSGGQTEEQALNLSAAAFEYAVQLEGLEPRPDSEDVREALLRRGEGRLSRSVIADVARRGREA
jgi:hypothetical protein